MPAKSKAATNNKKPTKSKVKTKDKPEDEAMDAFTILKSDHERVQGLFEQFEESEDSDEKAKIVAEAIMELKVHATVEEQLFYPTLREELEDEEGIMDEADEEHHVAKILIAELEAMTGDEDHWEAKFKVLAESVRHHIEEEEGEMFSQAEETEIDFEALGAQMTELKARLSDEGVPPDAEAKMIQKSGVRGDSPAKQAQGNLQKKSA